MKRYALQDPFITKIGNDWVFGGTQIFEHPDNKGNLWWQTQFYYGEDLFALTPLTTGPKGMKDIRLVGLSDGRIGVFTRPQGLDGGRGTIGFNVVESLRALTPERMLEAELLNQFDDTEWGGANELWLLDNNQIGVLGHIAKFSEDQSRHYYPMAFILDPITVTCTPMKIIATRKDFLSGPSKRKDLEDVLFSAGIVIEGDHTKLYAGVSDAEVQCIDIKNPFLV